MNSVFFTKGGHKKNAIPGWFMKKQRSGVIYTVYIYVYIYIIMDVEPKIVGKPPEWMVKISGEKPYEQKWTIWRVKTPIFRNTRIISFHRFQLGFCKLFFATHGVYIYIPGTLCGAP